MRKKQVTEFFLLLILIGHSFYAAKAETHYTAKDANGLIVKQDIVDENQEFFAFDGLEYSIIGDHSGSGLVDSAGYVFGDETKAAIVGNITNGEGTSIEVNNYSSAIVYGNLFGDVRNFDSTLEIHGNIKNVFPYGMPAVFTSGDFGNSAGYKTQTTIFGNIQSAVCGVVASDGAHTRIVGNIDASLDGIHVGDFGDEITDGASCEVIGDVHAQENGVIVYPSRNTNIPSKPWIDGINSAIIKGNIFAKNFGIDAYGKVLVTGNIEGQSTGIRLRNGADVVIHGNVTSSMIEIDYSDTEYYNEYGEWRTYYGDGVLSFVDDPFDPNANNAKIQVIGDVNSTGACFFMECGKAYVCGNVKSDYQTPIIIRSVLPSTIEIDGSVLGNSRACAISLTPSQDETLIVKGSIIAKGSQSAIEICDTTDSGSNRTANRAMPQIIVKELSVENGNYIRGITHDEQGEEVISKELEEAAAAAIQYIVDIEEPENGSISVTGCTRQDGLMLAHEGDQLTVDITPNQGYMVSSVKAGSKADVQSNTDGTYTVTVNRGGGVTISADFCAIPDLPHTGDKSNLKLAIALLFASIAAAAFVQQRKIE